MKRKRAQEKRRSLEKKKAEREAKKAKRKIIRSKEKYHSNGKTPRHKHKSSSLYVPSVKYRTKLEQKSVNAQRAIKERRMQEKYSTI